MTEKSKIAFAEEDGTVETLWAAVVEGDRYRLENIPFFFYGVSLGDVVEARRRAEDLEERDPEDDEDEPYGFPYFEKVVEKSGNRTLRLAFARAGIEDFVPVCSVQDDRAREALDRLIELGCAYETFHPYLVAINVPAQVDLDHVMGYLSTTDLKWENGDPDEEQVPGRAIYLLGAAEAEQGEDQLGGAPPGVPPQDWPACADCGEAQTFVMLLRRHPDRLRITHGAVALFRCLRHEATDELPRIAARSAVLLLDDEQLSQPREAGPDGVQPLSSRGLRYERDHEPNPWAMGAAALGPTEVSKLGGYARWSDADHTPYCQRCGTPMALVAQLGPNLLPELEESGLPLYLFVCPAEHHGWVVG